MSVKCVQVVLWSIRLYLYCYARTLNSFNGHFCKWSYIVNESFTLLRRSRLFKNLCNKYNVVIDSNSLHFNGYMIDLYHSVVVSVFISFYLFVAYSYCLRDAWTHILIHTYITTVSFLIFTLQSNIKIVFYRL